MDDCLACQLTNGQIELPGGIISKSRYWVVEHCRGPYPVGTLIVKPFRHCVHPWELTLEESAELGLVIKRVSGAINAVSCPDQIYICLWSHADWVPGHIHFVLQPVSGLSKEKHVKPGPYLQVDLGRESIRPSKEDIEDYCSKIRDVISRRIS